MVDLKFFKPVAASITGTSETPGSFPAPGPGGSPTGAVVSTSGVLYVAQIASDGSVEVTLATDDAATIAAPIGQFVAAVHRTTLPTYTNGDGGVLHLDNRGRLLVSYGEGGITADVEIDQDPAPATPAGSFVSMKYEATLPTYAGGDAATLHADSRGRLIITSVDPVSGNTTSIATEDSAGPTNPVGTFPLAMYRTTLPTYTDGDAAVLHTTAGGLLRVSSTSSLPASSTTSSVAGAASSTSLLASNTSRLGATFFNEQATDGTGAILYILLDAAVASLTNYTSQVPPNSYYEVPYGYTGEIRGIWDSAAGDVRVTELT